MSIKISSRKACLSLLQQPCHVGAVAVLRNERAHQVDLGFDRAHDDLHVAGELGFAAMAYLWEALDPGGKPAGRAWPWSAESGGRFRAKGSKFANLAAAGALIMAEMERMLSGDPNWKETFGLVESSPILAFIREGATTGNFSEDGKPMEAAAG